MKLELELDDILGLIDVSRQSGTFQRPINSISTLADAEAGDLSFLGNNKYKNDVGSTMASVVLLPEDWMGEPRNGQCYLYVQNPSLDLARICQHIQQQLWPVPKPFTHSSAIIADDADIADDVYIGPACIVEEGARIGRTCYLQANVYIGRHARIGSNCRIMASSKVMDYCILGERVSLQSGTVVGSDGFGYEFIDGRHHKIPQVGKVYIADDVEIGANTTIDRARFGETRIGKGSKIDNLVQIGHNVRIGEHCIVVAQVGISGSTVIEDMVVIAGQAGLAGHLSVGKGTQIGAQSGLNHDLEPGSYVRGTPAMPYMLCQRVDVLRKRFPELFKRVAKLEDLMKHADPGLE